MATIVIISGGFHPYHAGHYALYQSAQRTFPDAEVYVAATNDTSSRPFPFAVKEKLAKLAGVAPGKFIQVKSPFKANEVTDHFDPEQDVLIFVRSEKDAKSQPQPGGVKKDGSPAYLQPLLGAKKLEPFSKHAYMAYLPTVEFGPGMTSATQIRGAWPGLDERRKTALVMSLYPKAQGNAKLAATVVKLLDAAIGGQEVAEGLEQINEYRNRLLQYVKSLLPTWPDYVLKDWLVPNKGDFSNLPDTELKNGIMEKLKGQGLSPNTKWQLVPNMKFTMDMFNPMTKQQLVSRAGGKSDPKMDIPKDAERHATQAQLAQQQGGVRKEPVLLVKTPNGYDLLEGWHRTIQHFYMYPNGYTGPAYVAVAQGQQGVAEGAPIVVAQSPIDVRNPKKAPQPYRNQGDIVPDTKPPSTEKRGVKGRPGQRPMPKYDEDISRRGFLRGLGAAALAGAAGSAVAQTMPNINAQQVELANKYYNALVQRAKEDGRELDTRALNFLRAKAQEAAAQKFQQTAPSQSKPQQGFPTQGSERKVAKDAGQFESQGMAEAAKKCPPATQDITVNLNNRQKAINEYGYGPLNPDLPNTKFWMKKVDEWNLDSMEEAQSSLCGNCAAFDIRQDTLDCIAQGIDSDSPEDAEGVIDAGDLGYCKFLKFKCASRRTCDAWVTGGPLADKPVDENQGWAATYETNAQNFVGGMKAGYQARENQPVGEEKPHDMTDLELKQAKRFAKQHYPEFSGDEDLAFDKWVQRSLGHSEQEDAKHSDAIRRLSTKITNLQRQVQQVQSDVATSPVQEDSDYIEEKWSAKYKSSINCANPKGFSQKAHCAGRKK